ncbi:MAG: cupin domain-containing protein [Piscinibacter sp.]|uniref:cupin domain-containing protein n=1 Tax=Piscinibacter sp. TaxID=1903157 RepID=UPI003D147B23
MDRLSLLLQRFSLSAGVFYTGQICGIHHFERDTQRGHVHLIKRGPVTLTGGIEGTLTITEPTLLFLPRPDAHRLIADDRDGADVVCASIQFGGGGRNPITDSLPPMVLVPLRDLPGAQALLDLLYDEAFTDQCGRQAALDRLCELLLIRLLRHCLDRGLTQGGTLAGLADPRLSKTLVAVHEEPTRDWVLSDMAQLAGMSRARFAVHFREVIGNTPADYLATWRVTLAQGLLRAGRPLKHVALDVGYGSASAFTRAFIRKTGEAPTHWLRSVEVSVSPRA